MACSESCQCPKCMIQPGEVYPPEPTDSELRQRLLDADFEANPSGYISSQIPGVGSIFVETIGKTKAVFVGSKYIPCNSLASAVALAICIKKATEPTGVEG